MPDRNNSALKPRRHTSVTATERRRFYDKQGIAPGTARRVACSYCGATGVVRRPTAINFYAEQMEIDHVVPRHLGGALDVSNLTWACITCNRRKGHLADWTSPNGALVNGKWAR